MEIRGVIEFRFFLKNWVAAQEIEARESNEEDAGNKNFIPCCIFFVPRERNRLLLCLLHPSNKISKRKERKSEV